MLLQLCAWPEVESYLQRERGILIPIGSTEQHGPSGLIGTDAICAETIARGVGERHDLLVATTLGVGMALHHLGFPGSISLRPRTLIALVEDYVLSLARAGFRRFFFVNGHGGNVATLRAAFAEVYAAGELRGWGDLRCQVCNWYQGPQVYGLAKRLYGEAEGSHATPSEVALTQYVYPDCIKPITFTGMAAKGYPIYSATDFRQHYPDGRMGSDPSLATPDHGRQFYELAVQEVGESCLAFFRSEV